MTRRRRPGPPCPHCGHFFSLVHRVDPTTAERHSLRRVRLCGKCRRRFVTCETTAKTDTDVERQVSEINTAVRTFVARLQSSPLIAQAWQELREETP